MSDRPTLIAIFGVTGDLARRKLIPALFSNFIKGRLPAGLRIVGVGRRDWNDDTLIEHARQSLENFASAAVDEAAWKDFKSALSRIARSICPSRRLTRISSITWTAWIKTPAIASTICRLRRNSTRTSLGIWAGWI